MQDAAYVRYDDFVEVAEPEEAALTEKILASIARINQETFDLHRHALRQAHAKSHGVLKGLTDGRPRSAAASAPGPVRKPASYPVIVRLSTAPGDIHSDRVRRTAAWRSRCSALMATRPIPPMRRTIRIFCSSTARSISAISPLTGSCSRSSKRRIGGPEVVLAAVEVDRPRRQRLAWRRRPDDSGDAAGALAAAGNHILGETFHSMAAVRYGDYIAKLRAAPLSASVRQLTGVVANQSESVLRDLVVEFFRTQTAEYEICAQLCVDLARMPVEDASVEWSDALSPPQRVATLTLPPQEAYSPARRVYADDQLSFTAWKALAAHRPLGSIMRLRLKVYEASSRFRHAMNAREPAEPADIAALPD